MTIKSSARLFVLCTLEEQACGSAEVTLTEAEVIGLSPQKFLW